MKIIREKPLPEVSRSPEFNRNGITCESLSSQHAPCPCTTNIYRKRAFRFGGWFLLHQLFVSWIPLSEESAEESATINLHNGCSSLTSSCTPATSAAIDHSL
nr:hypothetical protein CFP56_03926 [Quercus suber]